MLKSLSQHSPIDLSWVNCIQSRYAYTWRVPSLDVPLTTMGPWKLTWVSFLESHEEIHKSVVKGIDTGSDTQGIFKIRTPASHTSARPSGELTRGPFIRFYNGQAPRGGSWSPPRTGVSKTHRWRVFCQHSTRQEGWCLKHPFSPPPAWNHLFPAVPLGGTPPFGNYVRPPSRIRIGHHEIPATTAGIVPAGLNPLQNGGFTVLMVNSSQPKSPVRTQPKGLIPPLGK